jgi:teichuronic acid exporter
MSDSTSLDRVLLSGIAWTAVMRWSSQVVSWAATIVVARILLPADYGLVAMAMIPIGLVRMVEDFGLDAILVQDRTIVGKRQAQLAGFVLGIGATLTALTLVLARPIAAFFDEPQVTQLISAFSVLFVTDSLQVVSRAILQRRLQFSRLAVTWFLQVLVTQGVLVAAAVAGFGMWAIVASNVVAAIAVTSLLWIWAPYAISWPHRIKELALPLLQGWRVMASRFAYYAYSTADQTIIGRFLGKDALGAYSFTTTFANLPFQEVAAVVTRVVPGVFSAVQERRDELRRYFLMLTECLSYITLPMAVGLALTTDLIVPTVLGPNWGAVTVPLQVMCFYAAFQGMQILISPILMWTGQFRVTMWCSVLTGVLLPLGFLVAVNHGLVAIAIVWSILYPLTNIPPLRIGLQTVGVSWLQWLGTSKAAACACLVMAAAVLGVRTLTAGYPEVLRLAVVVFTGGVVYAAVLWFGFRARIMTIVTFVKGVYRSPSAALPVPDPA